MEMENASNEAVRIRETKACSHRTGCRVDVSARCVDMNYAYACKCAHWQSRIRLSCPIRVLHRSDAQSGLWVTPLETWKGFGRVDEA